MGFEAWGKDPIKKAAQSDGDRVGRISICCQRIFLRIERIGEQGNEQSQRDRICKREANAVLIFWLNRKVGSVAASPGWLRGDVETKVEGIFRVVFRLERLELTVGFRQISIPGAPA